MIEQLLKETKERMDKAEASLQYELGSIRAGRANASLLDRIQVEYYGVPTPLNQLAQISVPEPRMLMITPYDKSSIKEIERSILQSDIGISPSSDGNVIRLVIPQLTAERRKDLAKLVGKDSENAKIAVRNVRRDAINELKKFEKDGEISEDDLHTYEKNVQEITDNSVTNIDTIASAKEDELLDV